MISEANLQHQCRIAQEIIMREAGSTSGFSVLLADQDYPVAIRPTAQHPAALMDLAPVICLSDLCTLNVLPEVADGSVHNIRQKLTKCRSYR